MSCVARRTRTEQLANANFVWVQRLAFTARGREINFWQSAKQPEEITHSHTRRVRIPFLFVSKQINCLRISFTLSYFGVMNSVGGSSWQAIGGHKWIDMRNYAKAENWNWMPAWRCAGENGNSTIFVFSPLVRLHRSNAHLCGLSSSLFRHKIVPSNFGSTRARHTVLKRQMINQIIVCWTTVTMDNGHCQNYYSLPLSPPLSLSPLKWVGAWLLSLWFVSKEKKIISVIWFEFLRSSSVWCGPNGPTNGITFRSLSARIPSETEERKM